MSSQKHDLRAMGAMALAVVLFSVMAAAVAGMGVSAGASLCLTAFGGGASLTVYALLRREPTAGLWSWPVLRIGSLALLQAGLYFAALRMAPVGPAAALHLCAPALLLGWALLRGHQPLDVRAVAVLLLIVLGLVGAALVSHPSQSTASSSQLQTMLGLAAALASAAVFAVFISQISRHASRIPLVWSNAARSWFSGLVCLPLLALDPPSATEGWSMVLIGAALLGPGLALAWFALSRISPQITSTIELSEAGITPVVGHLAWGTALTLAQLSVMLPIVAAVYLQVTRAPALPAPADSL